jgi:hypothetical protein
MFVTFVLMEKVFVQLLQGKIFCLLCAQYCGLIMGSSARTSKVLKFVAIRDLFCAVDCGSGNGEVGVQW